MPRLADQISYEPLSSLRPDRLNPRLPKSHPELSATPTDNELFIYIARHFSAGVVAQSIADFGYFPSEPLITVPGSDQELIVVEGNRRLTALKGLANPELRSHFPNSRRWDEWAAKAELHAESRVAVLRAADRDVVAPLIGYRHIAGIKKWDAYARASYVAQLVDEEGESFNRVAELVGVTTTSVKGFYRNVALLRQASEVFGLPVQEPLDKFGVFTAALNRIAVREYIGAPAPADVQKLEVQEGGRWNWPLPPDAKERFGRLLGWLYTNDFAPRVIEESRDVGRLATVLATEEGAEELIRSGSLEAAEVAAGLAEQEFIARLLQARVSLESALSEVPERVDGPTAALLDDCEALLKDLRTHVAA